MSSERGEFEIKMEFMAKIDELEELMHKAMLEIKIMLVKSDKEEILDIMPLVDLLIRAVKRMRRD
ncbi:MAG: hypothetical protein HWN68_13925 [Desulfobacterales bacterium]|nr:hypothetical protein [Desulfobacterales bacterium]